MKTIQNAKIQTTTLGFEDHGIMTAWLHLEYEGAGQGFGGWALTDKAMYDFVKGVLDTLEVDEWEKLKGVHCRVEGSHMKIERIGHIIKDKWFDPAELWKKSDIST